MVKKDKKSNVNNPDRVETAQEIQLNNLSRLIELEKRFEENEEKLASTEEKYLRILADYQNQQRRHKEQESQIIKMASASLLEKLLLNMDSLQLAQSHLKDKGLQMVIEQFMVVFKEEGLALIETDGNDFDPITMDCTEIVPGKKDQVVETVAPGYFLFDKVLRPAKVKVGSGINNTPSSRA
ncbi:MAG: Protein GrpE [Candidatus Collierbacteria bacterium GW2011_GWB1_44_6]|uniref:Protein GrpE n=2 Tax=Candidatus Collieribacteriota TaxID=1752725 RepID=A0A0G1MMG8_9BACT|nr:MAG: Protein GrpE [Candidatus Collierbacteria bacterium GW2011_GWC2_43_12]KKT73184.1 MAG: Protein GrpE [Candidatus Collierbacteria bacterium GW2011_GWB1_44_6]KKT83697.1 MAG: Protein GrpE [Microgenomates group bacterium GW2011_GWC1_44_9]